jgi:hypothetical protein
MKGFTHYISGIALASFLPSAIDLSSKGSFVLLLAGLGATMPDVIDFRFSRYAREPDVEICPDPDSPDPQRVVDQILAAIELSHQSREKVSIRFDTARPASGLRFRYAVSVDAGQVWARVQTMTDESVPLDLAHRFLDTSHCGHSAVRCVGEAQIEVEDLGGAWLELRPGGDSVEIVFLPWHRQWSHSLLVAAALGVILSWLLGPLSGMVYFIGSVTHILEDQLGHMGSNLWFPFTRTRTRGYKLFHSTDAAPNLLAVCISAALILFNLDRFSPTPVLHPLAFLSTNLAAWALALLVWLGRRPRDKKAGSGQEEGDA